MARLETQGEATGCSRPEDDPKVGVPLDTREITLAADLAEQDRRFQDFVVAHELLHLRVPNLGVCSRRS